MNQNLLETFVGFIVLAGAAYFLYFSYARVNKVDLRGNYTLTADFQNIEGITQGSDILIAGVKVGSVDELSLNHDNYEATLHLRIADDIKIPTDSQAVISTSGLLGGKFISIVPGSADDFFDAGGKIKYTQSAVNLETLLGKMFYSGQSK